ncbi:MAG: broad specificity phosphatase PhoE [Myxococcota bacterium]|jgi:broad specificity phosphatase PhoE
MHLGDFEGVPATTVHQEHPALIQRWVTDPAQVRMPGADAETLAEVQARSFEAVTELLATHRGKTIVAVSHTFTLLMILCRFMDVPIAAFRRMHIDRASISEINWNRFGPTLRRFNDTSHLFDLSD